MHIFGIPLPENGAETAHNCLEKVKEVFKESEVAGPDDCIDRANRIGRVKTNDNGKK